MRRLRSLTVRAGLLALLAFLALSVASPVVRDASGSPPDDTPASGSAAGLPPVHAGTDSDVRLVAPLHADSVTFVVFGDRTGGKPSGLRILERAVETANRLDPDFVMTVGDMVQGYTGAETWADQAAEYRGAMSKLRAPWYPVAGNHDVYGGKARPDGNVDLFQRHFGPLWYSFDCAWAHVVCLFSDESLSFADPPQDQNFSDAQLEWLAKDLAATKAEQVFVLLHHPRWLYEGTNWPRVHEMLVRDGRCRAVFAGHLHVGRDDGVRDGIRHLVLSMTGAESDSPLTETAAWQHVAHVRLRRDRVTIALLPVGAESGADRVLGAELDAMQDLVRGDWLSVEGVPQITPDAGRASTVAVKVGNPTDRPLAWTVVPAVPAGWTVDPATASGKVTAGSTAVARFRLIAPAWKPAGSGPRPAATFEGTVEYVTASGLRQPIRATREAAARLVGLKSPTGARTNANRVLVLDGKSAVRVPVAPETTALDRFTLECWATSPGSKEQMTVTGRTQDSSFGIAWNQARQGRWAPAAYVHLPRMPGTKKAGYVRIFAQDALPEDRWVHLALVHDGAKARLYVDGKKADEQDAPGRVTTNSYAFWIGAGPGRWPGFQNVFRGSIDELRLSRVARYAVDFKPPRFHERDADTVLLFHFDAFEDGLLLDDSGNDDHGWPEGAPRVEPGRR